MSRVPFNHPKLISLSGPPPAIDLFCSEEYLVIDHTHVPSWHLCVPSHASICAESRREEQPECQEGECGDGEVDQTHGHVFCSH